MIASLLISVFFLAVVAGVYWPCREGEFIFDDKGINDYTAACRGDWRFVLKGASDRRLTWASYALNVWAVGPVAKREGWTVAHLRWFHGVNIGLHGAAVLILWVVL